MERREAVMCKLVVAGLLLQCVIPAPLAASPPVAVSPLARAPMNDKELISAYEGLERQSATAADDDRFIAEHPRLLRAWASPYGPALMWALEFERTEAAAALLRAGAVVPDGALALAARGGLDGLVKLLLARGGRDDVEGSALHAAARYGHASTLRLLIAAGADLGAGASNDGFTALHLAVIGRHVEAVRVLLAAKAPLEARDHQGLTPLGWGPFAYAPTPKHYYEKLGQPHGTIFVDPGVATAMNLLLDAGARVDTTDVEGNTPLHLAVMLGSLRGAEALLARGARVDVKNRAGETPRSMAKARNHTELLKLFGSMR
jgi:ankyrin repeat protein